MLRIFFLMMLVLFPGLASAQSCWLFNGYLGGGEVVPPTSSTGRIVVASWFDDCNECPSSPEDRLYFWIGPPIAHPLEGAPIFVEVRNGRPGEDGILLHRISLEGLPLPFETYLTFDPLYCAALMDTSIYVVVGTDLFPDGEVRGQLIPQPPIPALRSTWGQLRHLYR